MMYYYMVHQNSIKLCFIYLGLYILILHGYDNKDIIYYPENITDFVAANFLQHGFLFNVTHTPQHMVSA